MSEVSYQIPDFRGLRQTGDGWHTDPAYAVDACNCRLEGGGLAPVMEASALPGTLPQGIGTLARLHRRYDGADDLLLAASGGKLYARVLDQDEQWRLLADGFACDDWDTVAYERNDAGRDPVDVLLMTNARDGMICVRGDDLTVARVATPVRFGKLARYAERLWGAAVDREPDKLIYSAAYDPLDWSANPSAPEEGAGDILQPSWDGDGFVALRGFGDSLLAFKGERVWRVRGIGPAEYVLDEQYGGGPLVENTIYVERDQALMLGRGWLVRYDGASVSPYHPDNIRGVMDRVNWAAAGCACAVTCGGLFHLALPLDGAERNNAVLTHDTLRGTWMLEQDVAVGAFLSVGGRLFMTSANAPGRVFARDAGQSALPLIWVGGWQTLRRPDLEKSAFTLFCALDGEPGAALELTLETERGAQTKRLEATGRERMHQVRFSVRGRRFRIRINGLPGKPWQLCGGVTLRMETTGL